MNARGCQLACVALCLVSAATACQPRSVTVDVSNTTGHLHHFWTSTGFCPPLPHNQADKFMLSPDERLNMAYVGAVPHGGIRQVRIHWLLELVTAREENGRLHYNFTQLDSMIELLIQNGLRPGFELMGSPSGFFTDFENKTQLVAWRSLVSELAKRYIDMYGLREVLQWNFETWNEPDHGDFDNISMTVQGQRQLHAHSGAGARGRALDPAPLPTFPSHSHLQRRGRPARRVVHADRVEGRRHLRSHGGQGDRSTPASAHGRAQQHDQVHAAQQRQRLPELLAARLHTAHAGRTLPGQRHEAAARADDPQARAVRHGIAGSPRRTASTGERLSSRRAQGRGQWDIRSPGEHSRASREPLPLGYRQLAMLPAPLQQRRQLVYVGYQLDNKKTNPYALWKAMGSPPFPSPKQFRLLRELEDPVVTSPLPVLGVGPLRLTLALPQPSVYLLHVCAKPQGVPCQVAGLRVMPLTKGQALVVWDDGGACSRCLKTFEVEFSPTGERYARIHVKDGIFTLAVHSPTLSDPGGGSVTGFYRVRAVDYWSRPGTFSLPVYYKDRSQT
ncbi:alpha-L-iduronidase isoform X2 [Lampetra planeri]